MLGDTNSDFKRKLLRKTEEKVRGYRSVALNHYCGNGYAFCVMISRKLGLAILDAFPITVDDQTVAHAWSDTMHLARAHNLSSYDAAYLELAIRLGLPLAALDGKLKTAAGAMGVPLFEEA